MAESSTGATVFHHAAVRVSDLDRSIAWYGTSFGFEVEHRGRVPEGTPIAMLRTAGGAGVELFELAPREDPHWSGPIAALEEGVVHFGLAVPDVEAAFERAVAAGGRAVWPPRDAPVSGKRIAFLADPDGNLVELIGPAAP
ncbi:MAG TPA: VOC family protein [Gaiellaceae bacterium]|nr:VOC family protein [Gaiellaceae bacterium]